MANLLYPKAKESFLKGEIDLSSDTIKVVFVDQGDYTYSASHQFLSDVAGAGIVGTAVALGSKTTTLGTFDAADSTLSAVTGDPFEYILIYKDTGVAGTSRLIALLDTATGLTMTPSGSNVLVAWHASGIFGLT